MDEQIRDVGFHLDAYNTEICGKNVAADQNFLVFSTRRHRLYAGHEHVGGLADRLKGALSCFYLSMITGRRFVLDWQTPCSIHRALNVHSYDWSLQNALPFILQKNSITHLDLIDRSEILDTMDWQDLETSLFKEAPVVVLNINSLRFAAIQKKLKSDGVQSDGYDLARLAYNFLFYPIAMSEFDKSREKFAKLRSECDRVVGVHLRTGGGNGWIDPAMDDWQRYAYLLERAHTHAIQNGAERPGFYFVSDSAAARQAVLSGSYPFPVMVDDEKVSHLDRTTAQEERTSLLAFHEFHQLGQCDLIIGGKGGFALTSAMVSGKPFVSM